MDKKIEKEMTMENILNSILMNKPASIDEIIEEIGEKKDIVIPAEMLETLIDKNVDIIWNEEFWEIILDVVSEKSLSNRTIRFLYDNKFAAIAMCHKQLPDKWLKKYSEYDDEPLFILADRSMQRDDNTFMKFVKEYAVYNESVFQYIIDVLPYSEKWKKMIFFGSVCGVDRIRFISMEALELFEISLSANVDQIREVLDAHSNDGKYLLKIAENPNTPIDLLEKLTSVKNVGLAKQIRMKSSETLKFVSQMADYQLSIDK